MADRGRVLFLVGEKKAEDIMLRNFFGKFPADQQNKLAKSILCTILEYAGPEWNPVLEGYPFLKGMAVARDSNAVQWVRPVEKTPEQVPAQEPMEKEDIPEIISTEAVLTDKDLVDNPIPIPTGLTNKKKPVSTRFKKVK